MIKAILFDFGQTLVNSADGFRAAEKEAQTKIFNDIGIKKWDEFISVYRTVRSAFHADSQLSRVAIWTEVYYQFSKAADTQLLEKWEQDYWSKVKAETIPFPETERVLRNLYTNYLMALITNTQGQKETHDHRINLFPKLERLFKTIIIAGQSGIPPKPDPIPFMKCLNNLDITPDEAVYIGDDWNVDICGARNAGILPIWLQHHSVRRTWPEVKSFIHVITSLDPLLNLEYLLDSS